MRKLLKYKNNQEYVVGGMAGIQPNGIEPIEEFDLSELKDNEFEEFRKNFKSKKFSRKIRKIK